MECEEYIQRRVKLGYVADNPTAVQLVDSIGNQVFDMLPVIQAGETDTSIQLLSDISRLRYYPEKYTRTEGKEGCYYDICIADIAALIFLNDLADVNAPAPATGQTIIYDASTQQYELFDLSGALTTLQNNIDATNIRIDNLAGDLANLTNTVNHHTQQINAINEQLATLINNVADLTSRLSAIENVIYNWGADKTTKIPRGTINVTSGGYNSDWGIFSRTKDQDNDLDFS